LWFWFINLLPPSRLLVFCPKEPSQRPSTPPTWSVLARLRKPSQQRVVLVYVSNIHSPTPTPWIYYYIALINSSCSSDYWCSFQLVVAQDLTEMHMGEFQGQNKDDVKRSEAYETFRRGGRDQPIPVSNFYSPLVLICYILKQVWVIGWQAIYISWILMLLNQCNVV
jgi:hypothetical protein